MNVRKPNILLITADQLRYDCIGSSGQYPVHTPNLDRLAEQSTLFSQAYSHIPVCSPARQSLLHGRRPETFGALWNYNAFLPVGCLQPNQYTWTKQLAENGYQSVFLGKWGVNPEQDPTAFGFDAYVSEGDYAAFRKSRYPDVVYTNGFLGETNPIPLEDAETHWFAGRAIEAMERMNAEGEPWHIALHFSEPHLPCRPAGRFAELYDPADVPEWEGFRETFRNKPYIQHQQLLSWGIEAYGWEDWAPIVARYYGIISQLDEAIGSVLAALERSGAADNTIVVFTADHGDMCGSHRMMDKHYILYDDVVHVPFMIRQPDGRQAGTRCPQFVYNLLDLGPTLLELAGIEAGERAVFHGQSLLPLLSGGTEAEAVTADAWRDAVVASYNGQQFGLFTQRMIRTKAWKYVWNLTDMDELYDLERDPAELDNAIGRPDLAELTADLRLRLYERLKADGDPAVGNEWTRRQLLTGAISASRK
ncbi:sulfatase-like hydrolase/transferase [Paenibacillus lycopersici]|uniref:Sulfatase-like hydrolase/transferase n=1 Tax=Paenibacillus lycopersici TaxID=2704462 RepID=A0A6C0FWR4_9BACL|nr:sulfatase-like hydrolase/transferase [Paenibacillus lycopersici]QHT61548.1 sulfatase-like hydrolase/transferase [Paenibacillus lycopersici]